MDEANVLAEAEPTTITHRRGQDEVAGAGRRGADWRLEDGPRGGEALPPGVRVGQGARRGGHGRVGVGGLGRRHADRRRRAAVVRRAAAARAPRRRPGNRRLAEPVGPPLPSRLELPGLDRDARRGSGAGAQRGRRQHAGHPRQPGRNPRHQRDLRPVRRGRPDVRPDPPLFDRPLGRARSRRPGVHLGRGRHGGRGAGEHPPPAGIGRKLDPRPHARTSSCASGWAFSATSSAAAPPSAR